MGNETFYWDGLIKQTVLCRQCKENLHTDKLTEAEGFKYRYEQAENN